MFDQQDGEAGADIEVAQEGHHHVDLGGAQAGHHLVEQQELRFGRQRPRYFEALAVGQGEALGRLMTPVVQAEPLQDVGSGGACVAERRPAVESADRDVLQHAQPLEGLHDLEGAADARVADEVGPEARDLPAVQADGAGIGAVDAGDHVEDRGLAGAIGADQRVDCASRHAEGDIVHGAQAAEVLADAGKFQTSARAAAHRRFSPKPKRSAIQGQTPAGRYITMIRSARP